MAQSPVVKKQTRPPVSRAKCTAYGLDNICSEIISGRTMTAISADIGVNISTLIEWAEEDPQRSARMRAARELAARAWDELAELNIAAASDPFELSKARELAQHYRWRAKAVAPREYGDKVTQEHTGAGGGPIGIAAIDVKGLTDAELAQMQALLTRAVPPAAL